MAGTTIRAATPDDVERIKEIAVAAEMFSVEEVQFFDDMLGGFFDGSLDGHRWLVMVDERGTTQAAVEEARIRQFYGPDDDKVVFWKSLA